MFRRARLAGLALALSGLWVTPVWPEADRLEQISQLAELGASRFALHLLDRYQPPALAAPDVWMQWERERTLIYIQSNQWGLLLDRASQRPEDLPDDFARWQDTRIALAWLELGEIEKARNLLLSLIWRTPAVQRGVYFARWRELIIRSYLTEGRYDDAHLAWLRYRLDYAETTPPGKSLSAEVLLRTGQLDAAYGYLESPETGRERLLAAIIESELGRLSAIEMWQQVESLLSVGRFDPTLALEAWIALDEVAGRERDLTLGCQVMERALGLAHQRPVAAREVGISGEALWQRYETVASEVANDNQLLVGRFDEWLVLIDAEVVPPVASRALLAFLVVNGSGDIREIAESRLVTALQREPQGNRILHALYLSSSRAHIGGEVPEVARYELLELALKDNELELARQLGHGLGNTVLGAKIIQARINLRENPPAGSAAISSLLDGAQNLSPGEVVQFHRAVNELGSIDNDATVLSMLTRLRDITGDPSDTAEIQLSMAAIEMRQLKFQPAAMSYLSASRITSDAAVERQALLQAARALSLGRMNEQAREIYHQVLAKPLPPSERRQIARELERLGVPP